MGQTDEEYQAPTGPPPGYAANAGNSGGRHVGWSEADRGTSELASNNPYRGTHTSPSQGISHSSNLNRSQDYQPPSGPPPDYIQPPSGPPPNYVQPPAGPPPGWSDKVTKDQYEHQTPPTKASYDNTEPPPYDPWLAVPDSSLLPPPPSIPQDVSPVANASYDDAARGHAWCRQVPVWNAQPQSQQTLARIASGDIHLTKGPDARNVRLEDRSPGKTHVKTSSDCPDSVYLSDVPLYAAAYQHRPLTGPVTIYYEVQVISMGTGEGDAGIAIGFLAPPYPSWRLPGWHRASLGIHGDDGRRFLDDSYGGKDFTSIFSRGDVVGVGMTFSPPIYQGARDRCQIFFTRNGRHDGGWDLYEERDRDAEEGDVFGLEGQHDLLAAVGCYGGVELEARFKREDWLWRG